MRAGFRCIAVAICLAASLAVGPAAHAADPVDAAGPQIVVSSSPNFLLGQSFSDPASTDGGLYFWNGGGALEYRWTASDPSDICRYSVDVEEGVQGWTDGVIDYPTNATSGQYSFNADGYENSDDLSRVRINAYDCAGNKSSVEQRSSWPRILVDHGPTISNGWERTVCTCFMGDSTLRTTTRNTSLSTVVNAAGNTKRVALVMAKGPGRGKVAIYYDGSLAKTVDTYAVRNTNRVVMWDVEIAGSAHHTIKVVNLATAGRPRIDIDAYIQG